MKLLICEDDISTIHVLKQNINFSVHSIDEILEAYNGEMAIKVYDENKPELVLCDIGMPKVDGIEVLQHIKTDNPITEFCFLTCYENFEYARKAIEYEASGYITKPFRLEEIDEMLDKMVAYYNKNKPTSSQEKQNEHDLLYQAVFRECADGIHGNDYAMMNNYLKSSHVDFEADSSWRIVFSCINTLETMNSAWSKELLLLMSPRISDEIFNNYVGSAYSFVNLDDRFIWTLTFIKEENDIQLEEKCRQLNDFCDEHFNVKPVFLISANFAFYNCADVVCQLYAMMRKLRYYGGQVFHQQDDISKIESGVILNNDQLLWYIKNHDFDGYQQYINNIADSQSHSENIGQLKKELSSFFLTLLKDNQLDENLIFKNIDVNKLSKDSPSKKNIIALAGTLMEIYQKEIASIRDSEDIISRAKKFVDDNYRENIDRDDVAEVAFVTPNYLSKLFKNNIGMNLREYINKLRVEESKRLLLSTNMSISEIAMYVGYYNISYFSTIFHKLVGVSPADWRERKGEQ